jgi:hypothetical protein
MEHTIFLDTEKINSIRESLDWKFNQIKIIDDSVTPQIIQWLGDFFSFHKDLKNGVFISNQNINLQRWAYSLFESKPYLSSFAGEEKEVLTETEYENFMIYISYCELKGKLEKDNEVLEEEIIYNFYFVKLPLLEPILSSVIKGINVKLNNSNKNKKHFEDLISHIERFYLKSISVNSVENETQNPLPHKLDCYPFQNMDIMNFFLHIEKNMTEKNQIFYSYLREFLMANKMFLDSIMNRKNYYQWINKNFHSTNKRIIKYQHHLSNTKQYFDTFESELNYFEKNIKQIPRID